MRATLFLALVTMAGGCIPTAGSWEGVWLLRFPGDEPLDCVEDVDENFDDAESPTGNGGRWTYEETTVGSDSGVFLQVFVDHGEAFGVLGGTMLVGTAEAGTLTLGWEGEEDTEDRAEHEEGYEYVVRQVSTLLETLTLSRDGRGLSVGTYALESDSTLTYTETDEWDRDEVGYTTGQLPASTYLVGLRPENRPIGDCDGSACELSLSVQCEGDEEITASYVGDGGEMFGDAEDAARPIGVD